MHDTVLKAREEINILLNALTSESHIRTIDVRRLSAKLFRSLGNKNIDNVLAICQEFLDEQNWAMGVIAFDWAFKVREQYNENTYDIFYSWLEKYVRGWGDCDDFCTHAFGELLMQNKQLFSHVLQWTKHSDFWIRRASAVILIPMILRNNYDGINPLQITDKLIMDEHDLVRKGYGWMLKSLSTKEPDTVYNYLIKHKSTMPRVAFRYSLEKMDKEKRAKLMK
ncbi:3-methyladenine DNA glycosylase AlkD [Clostridium amylolyticum]|uniref:3-methyladenine DNA glycosylase AlkD n=1 Tax=Clostridium amylolyticum TaxID=1121298 RepID=A0A1M6FIT0_9CLOT|nr:DNA alkylation repair protein [Clostridium amylolyticum]SHI97631.1 3-methyladenine DNA glycosylase AlkD [Clostridium amylolyticum]